MQEMPSTSRPMCRAAIASGTVDMPTASDRKSTRLNSSHDQISYAVFCLKKKKRHARIQNNRKSTRLNSSEDHIAEAEGPMPKTSGRDRMDGDKQHRLLRVKQIEESTTCS